MFAADPEPLTLTALWKSSEKIEPNTKHHSEITKTIAVFLAKDGLPIYTVEKPGFQHLIKKLLAGRYTIPSRKHFSDKVLLQLYEEVRSKVVEELQHVTFYSATTDLWSSIGLTPYLSLTIHFINSDWVLCSRNLNTTYMPEDHTGQNISELLQEMIESWNLTLPKLVAFTTDNGSNMITAMRDHMKKDRVACFGHILHNAVMNSLIGKEEVKLAILSCKSKCILMRL